MHVVVMFEPANPGENLTLAGQVNEIFGPFDSGEEAELWCNKATKWIKNRQWLIAPLSKPLSNGFEIYLPQLEF